MTGDEERDLSNLELINFGLNFLDFFHCSCTPQWHMSDRKQKINQDIQHVSFFAPTGLHA